MKNSKQSIAIILAIIAPSIILRPLAMDILLPAIPSLAYDFKIPFSTSQWFLSVFYIGAGLGQLFIGPLSDEYGRKKVLLLSTWLMLIASGLCALMTSTTWFLIARFMQGLGACGTTVVSMAMMRDLYSEQKLAKVYSYFNTIIGVSPLFAPVLGGILLTVTDTWRSSFVFVVFFSMIALVVDYLFVQETNPDITARHGFERIPILRSYKKVLTDKEFLGYCLCTIMGMSIMFMFFSMSSILLIKMLGIPAHTFSFYFAATMILYILGTLCSPLLQTKIGINGTIVASGILMVVGGIILWQVQKLFGLSVWGVVGPNMVSTFGAALLFGPCMAGVVKNYKHIAGIASAAYGALFLGGSALVVGAIMQFEIVDAQIMSRAMMAMGVVCLVTIRAVQKLHNKVSNSW